MSRLGICSVTLRHLDAAGGDLRRGRRGPGVRRMGRRRPRAPGDEAVAADVRAATLNAGLAVASYGSYYRAGHTDPAELRRRTRSAVAARGAPRPDLGRRTGTEETSPDRRAAVADTRRAGALAADAGIHLAFEFHRNTLTDGADRTLRLLDEMAAPMSARIGNRRSTYPTWTRWSASTPWPTVSPRCTPSPGGPQPPGTRSPLAPHCGGRPSTTCVGRANPWTSSWSSSPTTTRRCSRAKPGLSGHSQPDRSIDRTSRTSLTHHTLIPMLQRGIAPMNR